MLLLFNYMGGWRFIKDGVNLASIVLLLTNCSGPIKPLDDEVIENTRPKTFITSGPNGVVNSPNVVFHYHGTDEEDGEIYKFRIVLNRELEGGDTLELYRTESLEDNMTFTLPEGDYLFRASSIDSAGAVDNTPAARYFSIDL